MNSKEFLDHLAGQLIHDITPVASIKTFTTNPDIIGSYTEVAVRQFIKRIMFPLHVCTGGVISPELCSNPKKVPQLDTIIWDPCPAPPIFWNNDFGLVPQGSSFGIVEIKRSVYSDSTSRLNQLFSDETISIALRCF